MAKRKSRRKPIRRTSKRKASKRKKWSTVTTITRTVKKVRKNPGESRSHLHAIELRLSNERLRLAAAKTAGERKQRQVWIRAAEKELAAELALLLAKKEADPDMSDAELLRELGLL